MKGVSPFLDVGGRRVFFHVARFALSAKDGPEGVVSGVVEAECLAPSCAAYIRQRAEAGPVGVGLQLLQLGSGFPRLSIMLHDAAVTVTTDADGFVFARFESELFSIGG